MTELLTAAQMRAAEQSAIDSNEVTGIELMERAGQGVIDAIFDEWPDLAATSHRAIVFCGPGNNGGDGFVIARLLKGWGWDVEIFLYGDIQKLPPDARANYERWSEIAGVRPFADFNLAAGWGCDLVIDALFGTGLKRGLPDLGALFRNMEETVQSNDIEPGHPLGHPAIAAVDIPSGICADSGRDFPNEDVHTYFSATAHLTVSFHRYKVGHFLDVGAVRSKKAVVKDIGLRSLPNEKKIVGLAQAVHPSRARKNSGNHKFSHGHAIVLSGSAGTTGAARLAARGALRIGAGLVTLGVPPAAQMEVASHISAIMLRRIANANALTETLTDPRYNAICIGPGLGLTDHAHALVRAVLKSNRPTVLDADALTILQFDEADGLVEDLHKHCVLTPHAGEFGRIFPDIATRLNENPSKGPAYSKVDATRDAARRAGCVVLFKGPDTVIAAPDGRCTIHSAHQARAAPWLATAGSGDVLAGFVAGLMARGQKPWQAAIDAAYLHVECALHFGPGLISEDLPEQLPGVFRQMLQ
ncbi:MAG: NAD(P)H-hydrate dehydratase [Paracoccaceae bacterium]